MTKGTGQEAFYRADTSRNRNTGGSGLGLYIVGKIMEMHQRIRFRTITKVIS